MVPVTSLLIPIALSAVFVFIASSIIHMALSFWHKNDLKKFSNEDALLTTLRSMNLPLGEYGVPKPGSSKEIQAPEFQAKFKAGPVFFITVRPGEWSIGGMMGLWFLYSLAVSLIAGYIAGVAFGPGTEYLRIFQVAGCVAFTGYAMGQPQEAIWWGRGWGRTARNMIDGLLYGLLTGGTFGWLWPR
jgi:hypothetical protein